eukprot:GILJ01001798.1.p1 GENE.GILJ01001798.1~~GILJ01001798.1.p1  ORF type:complete len:278 (-),score=36.74 GILJ01001798.1:190-1023(-)
MARLLIAVTFLAVFSLPCLNAYTLVGPSANPVLASESQIAQLQLLVQQMTDRWTQLDAACSPNAIFALLYLYMTRSVTQKVQQNYFDDNPGMVIFTQAFASHYTNSYDAFYNNSTQGQCTRCWTDAFQYGDSGKSSATEDLFLGMNCHINYDLSQVVNAIGTGPSKRDYDRIDDVLMEVAGPASAEIATRYDPFQTNPLMLILTPAVLTTIFAWRENAWQNGMLLQNAFTSIARGLVLTTIDTQCVAVGLPFHSYNALLLGASTAPQRVAFCQEHHY